MPRKPSPPTGLCMETNALAWLAMLNLIARTGTGVSEAAEASGISRATLTLPPRYSGAGPAAAPLTVQTAIAVQDFLHTRRPVDLADASLTSLVARLRMSPNTVEVRAPARWLDALHQLDTRREADPGVAPASGNVRERWDGSPRHVSQAELAFRVEALISTLRTLRKVDEVDDVIDRLGGVEEVRRRYIVPLMRNAVAPPMTGLDSITTLARIGLPALTAVEEELHQPWGFRLFRVVTYAVANVRSVDEDTLHSATPTDLEHLQIEAALRVLLAADERVRAGSAVDVYPGRALHIDLLKELATLHDAEHIRVVRDHSERLVAMLLDRARNRCRPSRERCYALWLLHHLSAITDSRKRVVWRVRGQPLIDWVALAHEFQSDDDAGVAFAIETMSDWSHHARWEPPSTPGGLARPIEQHPTLRRLADAIDRAMRGSDVDVPPADGEPPRSLHAPLEPAVRVHLVQALTTPNGRWRRQVADAMRGGLMHQRGSEILRRVLHDETVDLWIKDRVAFMLGFLQDDDPATADALYEFAAAGLDDRSPARVEATHAALIALADVTGLAPNPATEPSRRRAQELFGRALAVEPTELHTRLDLAAAYGLYVITPASATLPSPTRPEQAAILRDEWIPDR